MRREQEQH